MLDYQGQLSDPRHRSALEWFAAHSGEEMSWPQPLGEMFLVNKAKGIHKPAGSRHALSIRQSLGGPYSDRLQWGADGRWFLSYAYEGADPEYFTNRAMRACMKDGVPVGVIIQVKEKPQPRYRVLGLGEIIGDDGLTYTIRQVGGRPFVAEAVIDLSVGTSEFDVGTIEDARKHVFRSLAMRRGQPAFRKALLQAYDGHCAISICRVTAVLEAAHIVPYMGPRTNHVQNGLLLRADLHSLFDQGHLIVDPERFVVSVSDLLKETDYSGLSGQVLLLPNRSECWPSRDALRRRLELFRQSGEAISTSDRILLH